MPGAALTPSPRTTHTTRPSSAPAWPLVGAGCIAGCLYLFVSLPVSTQVNFFIWNGLGLVLYFAFARRNTRLAKGEEQPA